MNEVLASLILGLIFIVSGLILYLFPPKKINNFYGYRTPTSMQNEETWMVANRYASKLFILFGGLLSIIGLVSKSILITVVFMVIFNIFIILMVEKKIGGI